MATYPKTFSADEWNFKIIDAGRYDDNVVVTTQATKKSVKGQVVFDVSYNCATKALDFEPNEKKCTGDLYTKHIDTPDIACIVSLLKQKVRNNVILEASGDLRPGWRSPVRVCTPEIQPREPPNDEGLNSPGAYPEKFTSPHGFEFNIYRAVKRDKDVVVDGKITKKDRSGQAVFDYTFSCDSQQQNIGVNCEVSDGEILDLLKSDEELRGHLENELYQQVIMKSKWKPANPEKSEDLGTDEGTEKATSKRPSHSGSGDIPPFKKGKTSQGDKTESQTEEDVSSVIDTSEKTDDIVDEKEVEEDEEKARPKRVTRSTSACKPSSIKKDEKDKKQGLKNNNISLGVSLNKTIGKIKKKIQLASASGAEVEKRVENLRTEYAKEQDAIGPLLDHVRACWALKKTTMPETCRREIGRILYELSDAYLDVDDVDTLKNKVIEIRAQQREAEDQKLREKRANEDAELNLATTR